MLIFKLVSASATLKATTNALTTFNYSNVIRAMVPTKPNMKLAPVFNTYIKPTK
jgi:hypothetical protein